MRARKPEDMVTVTGRLDNVSGDNLLGRGILHACLPCCLLKARVTGESLQLRHVEIHKDWQLKGM